MSKHVIHVDADDEARAAVRGAFEESGATVTGVATAAGALDALAEEGADCVVCERDLPESDAASLIDRLDAAAPAVPVVVYTDDGSESVAGAVVAAGADGYVPKEDGPAVLGQRVEAVVDDTADAPAATTDGAAERAVESSAERLSLLVEQAPLGVIEWDLDFRVVAWNPAATELFGYDREAALGRPAWEFVPGDARGEVERIWSQLRAGEGGFHNVNENVRADGSRLTCEWHNTPMVDGEGDVVGVISFVQDVTERERMAAALREREAKIASLHQVAASLDDCETEDGVAAVVVEAAADVLALRSCALALRDGDEIVVRAESGDPPEPFTGRASVEDSIAGRSLRECRTLVLDDAAAAEGVDPPGGVRSVLSTPIGDRGVLQAIADEPGAYDEDDAELAEMLAAHASNALERVRSEAELRRERDRMAALFDNVPDPVVSTHHAGEEAVVREVNPAFETLFGYEAEEITGDPLEAHIVPEDARDEAERLNERAREGESFETEVRRLAADGLRDFQLTVVPVDVGEANPVTFGVYTDVTERKQRRERVEVLNRVLRHDLRNGMTLVVGAAEQIAELADGDVAEHAEVIVDQAEELLGLADRTRTVEEALDRGEGATGRTDLVAVLESVVADLRTAHPDADVSLSAPESAVVRGGSLLEVALSDVLENAVAHNDRSEPRVEVSVRTTDGDAVVVRVADDGPGIPASERRLLTGDEEVTQLRHASGLGLWLVRWAVTHAGGSLSFADNDPRGSVVTVRLPLAGGE